MQTRSAVQTVCRVALSAGAILFLFVSIPVLTSKPSMKISPETIVVSDDASNFPQTTSTTISNIGCGTLEIENITKSCNCVALDLEKSTIRKGESALLKVTLNQSNDASVLIQSNDESQPWKLVRIKIDRHTPVTVLPARLDFGVVLYGGTYEMDCRGSVENRLLIAKPSVREHS